LSEPGKSSKADCTSCEKDRSTGVHKGSQTKASCLCKRSDYYQDENENCQPCPKGADCSNHDGIVLAHVTALPGFWRHENNFLNCDEGYKDLLNPDLAKDRCCPIVGSNVSKCASNSTDQCKEGYAGTLCMTCTKGYVRTGFECVACEGGPDQEGAIHAIAGLCFVLFVIFSIVFMKAKEEHEDEKGVRASKLAVEAQLAGVQGTHHAVGLLALVAVGSVASWKETEKQKQGQKKKEMGKKKQTNSLKQKKTPEQELEKRRRKRQSNADGRLLRDQIMIQRVSGGTSSSDSMDKSDFQLLQDRLKVVFGWMQVFGSLCVTYEDVPWPPMFESFSVNVGVMVNLGKCCCFSVSKCCLHLSSYHCCSSQTSWACLDSRLAVSICLSLHADANMHHFYDACCTSTGLFFEAQKKSGPETTLFKTSLDDFINHVPRYLYPNLSSIEMQNHWGGR
jgi:hypothetical protein